MKITVKSEQSIDIESLAIALANASPQEFAKFWLLFDAKVSPKMLDEFAQAMAPSLGGNRKRPLKALHTLMCYYEIKGTTNNQNAVKGDQERSK